LNLREMIQELIKKQDDRFDKLRYIESYMFELSRDMKHIEHLIKRMDVRLTERLERLEEMERVIDIIERNVFDMCVKLSKAELNK